MFALLLKHNPETDTLRLPNTVYLYYNVKDSHFYRYDNKFSRFFWFILRLGRL